MSVNPEILSESGFRQIDGESLPIFTRKTDDLTLFYAPGYLAAADPKAGDEILQILMGEIPFGNLTAHHLIRFAQSAKDEWRRMMDPAAWKPTCLTVYSSMACNLDCVYCFASEEHRHENMIPSEFILDAAREVLSNCAEKKKTFTVVFHGGGEPTLDPRLPELLSSLQNLSAVFQVPFRSYLATNGVMDAEKAAWAADNMDEIGLSVDGPPEIQDLSRPLRGGGPSSPFIERTAAIFKRKRKRLNVRVTVPADRFGMIRNIADYAAEKLMADEIRIEPVFCRGSYPDPMSADEFCSEYLKARKTMALKKIQMPFSGSRVGEIHGRYCQIFRQVLHLVPPFGRSPCFVLSTQAAVEHESRSLDHTVLSEEDPGCASCFNRFHCTRGCPDICPGPGGKLRDAGSFRCLVNRKIAEAELLEYAYEKLFDFVRRYGYAGIMLRGE